MTQMTIALIALQAAQAWRLREFGWLGIAMYTAGPELMVTVTLLLMWQVTGTTPWGVTAACAGGCIAQLLAEKVRLIRNRKNEDGKCLSR
jgi:hypothetical protein